VDQGLTYLRQRARDQLPLARALVTAIRSGDLAQARAAYIASRPPYEEIEVLAASFAASDQDIDARPYAFENGETDEDFKGFHKIEALIFRDKDLDAALHVAQGLVVSVKTLITDLNVRENFSGRKTFAGLLALSTEIAAKKISSEEETWSDRSLLIFRHNIIGINSQYQPFAAKLARRNPQAAAEVTAAHEKARDAINEVYGETPGGRRYSTVGLADRRTISSTVYRYRDALARAADILQLRLTA